MTIEEAALQLEQIYGVVSEEIKRALDVADDALSKQIAKKVTIDFPYEICPTCGGMYLHYIYKHYPDRYCPACGQKLKWEEENE